MGRLYSWVPKGSDAELKTLPFVGSKSMILWILSNGYYFWSIIEGNINQNIFCQFIQHLEKFLINQKFGESKKIIFLIDNWTSHRGRKAQLAMKNSTQKYIFLPRYSPQLAPVELAFNCIKSTICKIWEGREIKIWSQEGDQKIIESLQQLQKHTSRSISYTLLIK